MIRLLSASTITIEGGEKFKRLWEERCPILRELDWYKKFKKEEPIHWTLEYIFMGNHAKAYLRVMLNPIIKNEDGLWKQERYSTIQYYAGSQFAYRELLDMGVLRLNGSINESEDIEGYFHRNITEIFLTGRIKPKIILPNREVSMADLLFDFMDERNEINITNLWEGIPIFEKLEDIEECQKNGFMRLGSKFMYHNYKGTINEWDLLGAKKIYFMDCNLESIFAPSHQKMEQYLGLGEKDYQLLKRYEHIVTLPKEIKVPIWDNGVDKIVHLKCIDDKVILNKIEKIGNTDIPKELQACSLLTKKPSEE